MSLWIIETEWMWFTLLNREDIKVEAYKSVNFCPFSQRFLINCSNLEDQFTQISASDYFHFEEYARDKLDKLVDFDYVLMLDGWEYFGFLS